MKKIILLSILFINFFGNIQRTIAQEKSAGKIVKDYFAWIDSGNLDGVGSLLTEDFQAIASFSPVPFDKKAWRGVGQNFNTAFSGMKHEIVDWFADGNKVAVKGMFSGKNTGPNMGMPPTGNAVKVAFNTILELDGKGNIRRLNTQFDLKSFESQLMMGINPMASAEQTALNLLAAADEGNVEKMLTYLSSDSKHYFGGVSTSNEELGKRVLGFKSAFPDIKRELTVVSSCNGTVVLKGWLVGTNTGSFMGRPATGKKIKVSALGVYKFNAEGKITEGWVEMDTAGFMAQLQ